MIPFAVGNFIYIAAADLIPEMHKETKLRKSILQFLAFLAGIGIMLILAH
ncbi:MAG: ZIP family metal transporter [archaeon]|nr:ZIP family metal transporter [archaeon]